MIELCDEALAHEDITRDEQLNVLFMKAYSLALTMRGEDATSIFRRIVKDYDVDAVPPFEMEPQVLELLKAARNDERERREDLREQARAELRNSVALDVSESLMLNVKGGQRVIVDVDVTDPRRAVKSLRLDFKRTQDRDFASLPFVQRKDGTWRAFIPGTYTRSDSGLILEWMVVAADDEGVLASVGSREQPRSVEIAPGTDMAEGLTAAERIPGRLRIAQASAMTAATAAVFGVAAYGVAGVVRASAPPPPADRPPPPPDGPPQDSDDAQRRLANSVAWLLLIVGSPLAATLAVGMTTFTILDGWASYVPVSVMAAGAAVSALIVLGASFNVPGRLGAAPPVAPPDELFRAKEDGQTELRNAAIVGMVSVVLAATTATALVIIDPQAEE